MYVKHVILVIYTHINKTQEIQEGFIVALGFFRPADSVSLDPVKMA